MKYNGNRKEIQGTYQALFTCVAAQGNKAYVGFFHSVEKKWGNPHFPKSSRIPHKRGEIPTKGGNSILRMDEIIAFDGSISRAFPLGLASSALYHSRNPPK